MLALKGLGRYPELRAAEAASAPAPAERFIIGTFVSVLWALRVRWVSWCWRT